MTMHRMSRMSRPRAARCATRTSTLVLMAALAACATGLGSNLGAVVSAPTDDMVTVTLDPQHPWVEGRQLRGTASLIASYDDGAGSSLAAEELSRSELGLDGVYRFRLPARLRAEPKGRVCLRVQVSLQSQGAKLLPVRAASSDRRDTTGFLDPRWEQRVVSATRASVGIERGRQASQSVSQLDAAVSRLQQDLQNRWGSQECKGARSQLDPSVMNKPWVIPRDRHPEEARKVCLYRVWSAARAWQGRLAQARVATDAKVKLGQLLSGGTDLSPYQQVWALPEMAEWVRNPRSLPPGQPAIDGEFVNFRRQTAADFASHWQRWSKDFDRYQPLFPDTQGDRMALGSAAHGIQLQWIVQQEARKVGLPNAHDLLPKSARDEYLLDEPVSKVNLQGWIGASLDAYDECVDDVTGQFGVAFDVAQRTVDSEERTRVIRGQCQADWAQLDKLKLQLTELKARQATADAQAADAGPRLPNAGATVLNDLNCP